MTPGLVGVARLELATSGPPAQRTTNCAIPRKVGTIFTVIISGKDTLAGQAKSFISDSTYPLLFGPSNYLS